MKSRNNSNLGIVLFLILFVLSNLQVFATSKLTENGKKKACFSNQEYILNCLELYNMETEKDYSFVANMSYEELMNFLLNTPYTISFKDKKETYSLLKKEPTIYTNYCELGFTKVNGELKIYCPYHGSKDGVIPPNPNYVPTKFFKNKMDKINRKRTFEYWMQTDGALVVMLLSIISIIGLFNSIIDGIKERILKKKSETENNNK